jgi:hypothetical protein
MFNYNRGHAHKWLHQIAEIYPCTWMPNKYYLSAIRVSGVSGIFLFPYSNTFVWSEGERVFSVQMYKTDYLRVIMLCTHYGKHQSKPGVHLCEDIYHILDSIMIWNCEDFDDNSGIVIAIAPA